MNGGNGNGFSGYGGWGGWDWSGDNNRRRLISGPAKGSDVIVEKDVSNSIEDTIVLDVGGMSCGGCAAAVRNILESQDAVVSASVNLPMETALARIRLDEVVSAASDGTTGGNGSIQPALQGVAPTRQWKEQRKAEVGRRLAEHLTECGFTSTLREGTLPAQEDSKIVDAETSRREGRANVVDPEGDVASTSASPSLASRSASQSKAEERQRKLRDSGRRLLVAWALAAACLAGHAAHFFHSSPALAKLLPFHLPAWTSALHSTAGHAALSLAAFLGPGRHLLTDGLRSFLRGSPNMNSLVGLGAVSSFAMSAVAAVVPRLGWPTFFEEPLMLLAFVLLGRALEERAKVKAASDMTSLLSLIPPSARLVTAQGREEAESSSGGRREQGDVDNSTPPSFPPSISASSTASSLSSDSLDSLVSSSSSSSGGAGESVGSTGVRWDEMASKSVPIGDVVIGDRVLVLPGDRVPVDGVVVAGKTSVDESSLTGARQRIYCTGRKTLL